MELFTDDLATLRLRSTRPAGAEPGTSAGKVAGASVVEVERTVSRDGNANLGGMRVLLAAHLAGQQVTLRLDGHLMHVVAAGKLAKTLPSPIPPEARSKVSGARAATSPLPPPAPPLRANRLSSKYAAPGQRSGPPHCRRLWITDPADGTHQNAVAQIEKAPDP